MNKAPVKIGMTPPHPGTFVATEVLEPLSLSVTEAAKVLHVRRATLSDFLNTKAACSPEMALRLEIAFGLDMQQLLQMQAWFDAATTRARMQGVVLKVKRYRKPEPA